MTPIDWRLLGKAQDFYASYGYRYVETPWIASIPACQATYHSPRFNVAGGCLVGSGEQGLLQVAYDTGLESGLYMTTTPCFRDEPVEDLLHQQQFMKLELMWLQPTSIMGLDRVIGTALNFFKINSNRRTEDFGIEATGEGFDITCDGIELGSYGTRKAQIGERSFFWTYGTGLALPRFTTVIAAGDSLVSTPSMGLP